MRVCLTGVILCGLLAGPVFAQSEAETSAAGAAEAPIPGLEVLAGALEQGGFTDIRVAGQDFVLLEVTHPQAGTIYLLVSKAGGAPIAPAGTGTPAPDLDAAAAGEPASGAAGTDSGAAESGSGQ